MENQTSLKPIPNSITKSNFCKMYYPFPCAELINEINEIIYECRKDLPQNHARTKKQIISVKNIKKKELIIFISKNSLPTGYENS